jgi:uncharacterized protein with PIN domain
MEMAIYPLEKNEKNHFICPKCRKDLHYVSGGAVRIVDGRADMSAVLPKYECHQCGIYFQEVLNSGLFSEHDLPKAAQPKKKIRSTGDLPPMELHRDAKNQCVCPRCGELMDYVEGQPVRLVDGKPDMDNVKDHFHCSHCKSMFRRIATTHYFQWSEK